MTRTCPPGSSLECQRSSSLYQIRKLTKALPHQKVYSLRSLVGVLLHSSGSELQNESITKAQKQARRMCSMTFDDPISRVRNIMIVAITVRSLLSTAFKNPKFVSRLTFPRMSRSLFCLSDERGMHFTTQDGQLIYVRTHSIDK